MSEGRSRRALGAVAVVGIAAIVLLLLGHDKVQGYLATQRERLQGPEARPSATAGVSGVVTRADGAPAAGTHVRISWVDSAGRPGSTPTVTDSDGRYSETNVPSSSEVTEIRASAGPLAAIAKGSDIRRVGAGLHADLKLPKEFRIAGLVRRAGDREPVRAALLEVGGVETRTSETGKFELAHIPDSALATDGAVVTITADGFRPLSWPVPPDDLPETYGDVTILLEPSR